MTYSALFLITALLFIGDFLILAPTAFAACRSAQSLFGIADAIKAAQMTQSAKA